MWARVVEVMLACWLAMSPFIFEYQDDLTLYWANDFVCATLISLFAFLSLSRRFDMLHLASLAVAVWLIGVACLAAPSPPPPRLQNYVVMGLLIAMIAIIPTRSGTPPQKWLDFYAEKAKREG